MADRESDLAFARKPVVQVASMEQLGISLVDEDSRTILKIQGSARVETAALLKLKLVQTKIEHEVLIDWGEAEHVDACVLQVLLALRQSLTERGLDLTVGTDNVNVRQYLKLSGLSEHFPVRSERSNRSPYAPATEGHDA